MGKVTRFYMIQRPDGTLMSWTLREKARDARDAIVDGWWDQTGGLWPFYRKAGFRCRRVIVQIER